VIGGIVFGHQKEDKTMSSETKKLILRFNEISISDVPVVGGKNASLGEMIRELTSKGVNLPNGFATTANAYFYFLEYNHILDKLKEIFGSLDVNNVRSLQKIGKLSRSLILKGNFPKDLEEEIRKNYRVLEQEYGKNLSVAVRSSATAEDLPTASFAGMHESFLNITGEENLLLAVKKCIASLFNDRAISYRMGKGFDHFKIALSVGVQKMVRSDLASSGVIFTLDTESGFEGVVIINSIFGVGEMIVKGKITPDQFYVFKPTLKEGYKSIIVKNLGRKDRKYIFASNELKEVKVSPQQEMEFSLTEDEILVLAKWALIIEEHYKKPQDIEWAKDGKDQKLYVVQSRPETVHAQEEKGFFTEYQVEAKEKPIIIGIAVGEKIGFGNARVIKDVSEINEFKKGEVLITRMTDPDWVVIMKQASAIVTDEGGRVCHAAIISRELGIPAIVGAVNATKVLKTGEMVTVDCTSGEQGRIYKGKIPYKEIRHDLSKLKKLNAKVMVNIGAPEIAFHTSFLPVEGVGLTREEFIIAEKVRVHPLALFHFNELKDNKLRQEIEKITAEHKDKKEHFIKELAEGIAQIASAFYPKEVIVRFSDFKSNEYKNLLGGYLYEKEEGNPMLGFRGAARYLDKSFEPAFKMECEAIKRVRYAFGLKNISLMIPFCRTVEEGEKVLSLMKKFGLEKGSDLKVYVMCEIPSNVILADKFLDIFDGMSIGSNDLTQLILGLDRDNGSIAFLGDERNEAEKEMIRSVIRTCKKRNKYIGICGEAPSEWPEFADFLINEGIDSISLNPESVFRIITELNKKNV